MGTLKCKTRYTINEEYYELIQLKCVDFLSYDLRM